jgi:Superinfection immunity protein
MSDATSGSMLILVGIYFAPTILALLRGHLSLLGIFLLNLFAGWTVLGWLIALVWAGTSGTKINREISTYGRPQNTLGDKAEAIGRIMKGADRVRY